MLILLLACAFFAAPCQPSMARLGPDIAVARCGSIQTARVEHIGADDWLVCDCPGNPVEMKP